MSTFDFKTALGLYRSISCTDWSSITDDQKIICEQVKDFGIDEIYFSTDEKKSYPAVFLKRVLQFDGATLKEIANIHKHIWNYQKVLFLYVYNDVEIRIYNCTEKPFVGLQDSDYNEQLKKIEIQSANYHDTNAIKKLVAIFSSTAIDSGIIWTLPEAVEIRKKINLQRRVDKYLVDSLTATTKCLLELGLTDITIIHKIILRSLFLLYLEDRGATDAHFYNTIKTEANSYFDILEDVNATYQLYATLEKQFNGNVFSVVEGEKDKVNKKHLQLIKKCFINGYEDKEQYELFSNWRLFDFKIIQIELLSEIYERFLAETDEKKKKNAGAFYTPPSLVTLILDEVLPINKKHTNYNVKILDPACGSGIFLVESYRRLLKRYENAHNEKLTNFEQLKKILTDNIYGIEQNDQAIIVAAFSLYLALVDNLDPKTLWISTKLPCLVNDPNNVPIKKQGYNLFCRDTIAQNEDIESISFDLVIGNPPFGTENKPKGVVLSPNIRNYCSRHGFAKEMVLPFLHKAIHFAPNGKIALIFNTKILTNVNSTYKTFREWLFNECYVEKIYNFSILRNAPTDFGGQLFGSAIGPVCVGFYQKEQPINNDNKLVYYAPKTYIKNNILEGVIIDNSDVKYLPYEECKKSDSKIWKIAMWGGENDASLIEHLSKMPKLETYLTAQGISYGLGLQFVDSTTKKIVYSEDVPNAYIRPEHINRYISYNLTDIQDGISAKSKEIYNLRTNIVQGQKINRFRRLGNTSAYKAPHVLVKEGLQKSNICASFFSEDCSFNSKVIGLHVDDEKLLKGLTCFLNSSLVEYFIFLCSPSIGIEREEVKINEIKNLPFLLQTDDLYKLADLYDLLLKRDSIQTEVNEDTIEKQINDFICDKYGMSAKEKLLIRDFSTMTKQLMMKSYKNAMYPVNTEEMIRYTSRVCNEINDFLTDTTLKISGSYYASQTYSSLSLIKLSFDNELTTQTHNTYDVSTELDKLDKLLWEQRGEGIYFRKKVTYYDNNDIYVIRPNQKRFWTESMAIEDATEIILEILNMEE